MLSVKAFIWSRMWV